MYDGGLIYIHIFRMTVFYKIIRINDVNHWHIRNIKSDEVTYRL